jgi:predicted nucleic acid-binding protein
MVFFPLYIGINICAPFDTVIVVRRANYRLLQSKGLTIRKTIDVIIGTFCAENGFTLVHNDRDFDVMAAVINLQLVR